MESAAWSDEKLYFDGDSYFLDVLNAIERAKQSVLLETYIYDPDPLGYRIESALSRAAKRGLEVRVLVDGIGAARWIERRSPEFKTSGAKLRVYHPVVFSKIAASLLSAAGFRKQSSSRSLLSHLNRRNHRKVCVIDNETAFVGSLNISAVHCASFSGARAWRDTGVRLKGAAIQELIQAFDHAWLRSHSPEGKRRWRDTLLKLPPKTQPFSELVRLNYTHRMRRRNAAYLRGKIKTSKDRVWFTNAYLAPSPRQIKFLAGAAKRGVDVRLLVPRTSDVFFMPWVAGSYYAPLLKAGVRIFEYLPRFLHAKSVIIDGWSTVGTSNMNRRSALYDFEVDVVLTKPESLRSMEERFALDLREAEEVRSARGGLSAWLGRFFSYVFKRWI